MTLGERIRKARKSKGMTLLDLATKVGVTEATMQRYECDKIKNPKQPRLLALAKALNVDVNYLMNWNQEDLPQESQNNQSYVNDDLEDITRIYNQLDRQDRHELMAMIYQFEREAKNRNATSNNNQVGGVI